MSAISWGYFRLRDTRLFLLACRSNPGATKRYGDMLNVIDRENKSKLALMRFIQRFIIAAGLLRPTRRRRSRNLKYPHEIADIYEELY